MKDERFEQKIKSKFDNFEMDIPNEMWSNIEQRLPQGKKIAFKSIYRYAAAIAALVVGAVALFYLPTPPAEENRPPIAANVSDRTTHRPAEKAESEPLPASELISTAHPVRLVAQQQEKAPKEILVAKTLSGLVPTEQPIPAEQTTDNRAYRPESERPIQTRNRWYQNNTAERDMLINEQQKYYQPQDIGLSVSLLASNISTESQSTIAVQSVQNQLASFKTLTSSVFASDDPLSYKHNMPLRVGAMVEKRIFHFIGIESGLTYSFLRSSYKNSAETLQGKQELHYIGIPLNVMYHIAEWGNLQLYTGVGGEVNFNVSGSRTDKLFSSRQAGDELFDMESTHSQSIKDQVQWSLSCKAGVAYRLVSSLDVYAEPAFSYYFKNGSNVENIWNEKPGNFSLQLGLRASF